MALDALFLSHLARELNNTIAGARIDKIHQPERDEIVLNLRAASGNKRLLLSAGGNYPRIHLTESLRENPQTPPMFCMLLRKYFAGGRIISVSQPRLERIVDITVEGKDEMGIATQKVITIELMGRYSNLILRDQAGRVLDCLKRVDLATNEKRQVLPGLFYELPPAQDKLDARKLTRAQLLDMILEDASGAADQWVLHHFLGFSPLLCREAVYRASGACDTAIEALSGAQKERLAAAILQLADGDAAPTLLLDGELPVDFSFCEITQYEGHYRAVRAESLSKLLDQFYGKRDFEERMRARSQAMVKTVRNAHARAVRKLAAQKQELLNAQNRERLRELGDLVTANLYRMQRGDSTLRAQDFFDPAGREVEIPLDIRLTPQQNAAKLYKDYTRMKHAEENLRGQMEKGEGEIEYLESVLEMIACAEGEQDLVEIREELSELGILHAPRAKKKPRALAPREFVSSDGFRIYAGRNNRQNDLLTLKSALKGDVWLHTQKIPGTHVIIECAGRDVPDRTLTEAACIAAYYSRARESQNVPVDYTQVRNVKKPPGARPGKVIYSRFQTAFVSPDAAQIERMMKG